MGDRLGPYAERIRDGLGGSLPPVDEMGRIDGLRVHGYSGGLPDIVSRSIFEHPDLQVLLRETVFGHLFAKYIGEYITGEEVKRYLSLENLTSEARQGLLKELLQRHLKELNAPLKELDLYPPFTSAELMMTPELKFPWLERPIGVVPLADGVAMPCIETLWGYKDGQPILGQFGFLMKTRQAMEAYGSLQLAFTKAEIPAGKNGKVGGKFSIPRDMLDTLNNELSKRGRAKLPENFGQFRGEKIPVVHNAEIHDENGKFFTIVTFHLSDGTSFPLLFNRLGDDGSHGRVHALVFSDGTFGLQFAGRVIIQKVVCETPRGFARPGEEKWATLWSETRLKPFEDKLGMKLQFANFVFEYGLWQDPTTDFVPSTFSEIGFDQSYQMDLPDEFKDATDEGFESIVHARVKAPVIAELIKEGHIFDAHSIAGFLLAMLRRGQLIINPDYDEKTRLILEKRYLPQLGKAGLVIPRGSQKIGEKLAELVPDTGKTRIFYQTRVVSPRQLEEGHRYIALPVTEIVPMMLRGQFDIVTLSALAQGFLLRGVLVAKETV